MPPERKATVLIKNIRQLITMEGPVPRIGASMNDLGIIENAGLACAGEEILAVGPAETVVGRVPLSEGCKVIDAKGGVATPGFIDPHTHPVFSKTRELEFEMRIAGKTYMEIAQAGGGIRSSVRHLRETSAEQLTASTWLRFDRMLNYGVTTVEAKSGYGLSTESEITQLEVLRNLSYSHPIGIVPTLLGAHDVPDEFVGKTDAFVEMVANEMIPKIASMHLAEFSDIFTETGVFDIAQSRKIQTAAKKSGFKLKFHADELTPLGGAELAGELGAISADHLMFITDAGIKAMKKAGTVAVLLPGTTFSLGLSSYAPARKLIDAGVAVALATDCNPGSSYSESLPFMTSLAALQYKMTAAETISAVTVNAACAVDRAGKLGQLREGMVADIVVWDMADYREMPYHYAVNLASKVIKKGRVVVGK